MPPRPAPTRPAPAPDVTVLPLVVAPLRSPWTLRERLARHAVLLVLSVLDLLAGAFVALQSRVAADGTVDPQWWQPLAGRVILVVLVWGVVVHLPVGPLRNARAVQFVSLATAASLALSTVLLALG